jgi:hypothetical protein
VTFEAFPKIPRLRRECTITEKIDGTNAAVYITPMVGPVETDEQAESIVAIVDGHAIRAQSRTRFIVPGADNFGFAAWVQANATELVKLGEGRHFGEWYGADIQRRYGLDHKRFALFNVDRWTPETLPACCSVVPTVYRGRFLDTEVANALEILRRFGSKAAPGFMDPEGIVVYMHASRTMHKVTLEKDEAPKGVQS